MSAPQKPWEGGGSYIQVPDLTLSNASELPNVMSQPSYLHPVPGTSTGEPYGAPALPPRPQIGSQMSPAYGFNSGGYSSYGGMGAMGSYGMGGMGGVGGGYGYGGYGGGYMGGMGAPYSGYNRFGPMDVESRFIQMAEESSRPAFQSIESVVQAVGSIAMMLDNTFFALTSSFRAVLGVAENFGRLRSLFAQVWSTFAVIRTLNWLIRKLMVMLGVRTEDEFKAWAEAVAATQPPRERGCEAGDGGGGAAWPALLFLGALATAPYILLRLMRRVAGAAASERLHEPASWKQPQRALATHDFAPTSPQEIGFRANQVVMIAPRHLQGNLWNSGWLMGSVDRQTAGLVPTTYVKLIRPAEPGSDAPSSSPQRPAGHAAAGDKSETPPAPELEL